MVKIKKFEVFVVDTANYSTKRSVIVKSYNAEEAKKMALDQVKKESKGKNRCDWKAYKVFLANPPIIKTEKDADSAWKAFDRMSTSFVKAETKFRVQAEAMMRRCIAVGEVKNLCDYETDGFCVSYDGGNHPEYASTMASSVTGIGRDDKHIYLITDDCDYLIIERLITCDLAEAVNALLSIADQTPEPPESEDE